METIILKIGNEKSINQIANEFEKVLGCGTKKERMEYFASQIELLEFETGNVYDFFCEECGYLDHLTILEELAYLLGIPEEESEPLIQGAAEMAFVRDMLMPKFYQIVEGSQQQKYEYLSSHAALILDGQIHLKKMFMELFDEKDPTTVILKIGANLGLEDVLVLEILDTAV